MKRGLSSQESFDSTGSQSTLSLLSSQHSNPSTLAGAQDQPSYTNQEWKDIFPDLIGLNLSQNEHSQLDVPQPSDFHDTFWPADVGGANIESWMNEELDGTAQNGHSIQVEALHNASSDQNLTCYGMVYRAKVKLAGDMSVVTKALHDPETRQTVSGSHFLLEITSEDGHLFVKVNPEVRLAQLNKQLEENLNELVDSRAICLEAVIRKRALFDDIGSATKESHAQIQININVYGSATSSSTTDCVYNNPHVIKFDALVDEVQDSSIGYEEVKQSEEDTLQASIQGVYSKLTRDAHLDSNMTEDTRLRTPLMPHQTKAQNFMVQRETGPVPEQFELWETIHKDEQIWYKHKIAGIRSRSRPAETGGGILADEMGMGKTFSMLSLVVSSLEAALEWAADPEAKLAHGILPSKQLSRATLVVVPSSLLLATWTEEIENRLKIDLKVFIHHGRDRPIDAKDLYDNDIVLTTYHTLHADYQKKRYPIRDTAWYRIILDEAHFVRSSTTHLHKRVAELDAKYRWCLTGTPIQNRLDDVGALLAFLRIFPFDRMGVFRQYITVPFKEGGTRRIAAQMNLAKLLDAMCIRRTAALLDLTDFEERTCNVYFSPGERNQYNKTKEDMKRTMHNRPTETASSNRFGAFQAQLQLRLLCNHGTHQHQFHWARARNLNLLDEQEDAASSLAWGNTEGTCSSCHQLVPVIDLVAARRLQALCAHTLCQDCRQGTGETCPLCDVALFRLKHDRSRGSSRATQAREAYFQNHGHSSKMAALVQELQSTAPDDKIIVFSHWTTTLDLVGRYLQEHKIYFERIDGNDNLAHRKKTLEKFRSDSSLRILVMTTGVGALGLDLIAANRVHLIEPQWNPSIELQAIGRTLRIGQQRTVTVTRYIVQDSVEQYMKQLQQRKLNMAGMAQTKNGLPFRDEPEVKNEILDEFLR